jgi:hypothetical protein
MSGLIDRKELGWIGFNLAGIGLLMLMLSFILELAVSMVNPPLPLFYISYATFMIGIILVVINGFYGRHK